MNKENRTTIVVSSHDIQLDSDYVKWICDVKQRFRNTQIKAAVKVNSEQLLFDWKMGRDLVVRIDMLFYHIHLKCYVVIELKATSFEPEFAGKLNFYVNAVNELIRTPDENPTIGLLICKDKDQTEVQWAFQGIQTPMGVASYDKVKLQEIQAQLPTAEQIQQRIDLAEEEYRLRIKEQ